MTPQAINAWRRRLSMTATEAAAALGVQVNTYFGYEAGRRAIQEPIRKLTVYVEKWGSLS